MANAEEIAFQSTAFLGTPYSTLDCQAFVEKCLKEVGIIKNLPGSNAWYREMTWVGTPEECKKKFGSIPVGAFLFILKQDGGEPEKYKPDGIGNASHIGIYTAQTAESMLEDIYHYIPQDEWKDFVKKVSHGDGAIHSSSSRGCVATSTFAGKTIKGGWNRIGLWDKLSYDGISFDGKQEQDKQEEQKTMTAIVNVPTGETVKLRQNPSTSCNVYWKIPSATKVIVEGKKNGWSKVTVGDKHGYIMSQFLLPEGESQGTGKIEVDRALLVEVRDYLNKLLGSSDII